MSACKLSLRKLYINMIDETDFESVRTDENEFLAMYHPTFTSMQASQKATYDLSPCWPGQTLSICYLTLRLKTAVEGEAVVATPRAVVCREQFPLTDASQFARVALPLQIMHLQESQHHIRMLVSYRQL